MLELVERVRVGAVECADTALWSLADPALEECLGAIDSAERALAAAKLHVIREIDGRGIPARHATPRLSTWLGERLRVSAPSARRLARLATAVDDSPALDQALSGGVVNAEQAGEIVATLDALPSDIGADVVGKAEAVMLQWADQLGPQQMRRMGLRVLEHVAPDVAEKLDAERVRRDNLSAHAARTLSLSHQGDGRVRLTGWLDTEAAAVVSAALDPLCSPRHPHQPGSADPASGDPAVGDDRTSGQRRADALVDVCRLALNTTELPDNGGDRPQLAVTIGFEQLRDEVGLAMLDTGDQLTPAQVRRLACDAHLLPATLGSPGQVLDVGQSRRLITGALRRALVLRDGGCAFPGCDRPPRWTEGHHIQPWAQGGPTSLDNGVLLCGHHHRVIHHTAWTVHLAADGIPEFIPPAHLDPEQRPRRNLYHRRT